MITFTCKGKGCSPRQWEGSLEILQRGNPCEAELCARGSRFHLIVGKHSYGNVFWRAIFPIFIVMIP